MSQFYQQGYHTIVLELNEDLPVGDMIDDSLPANSSLRTLMEKAHKLVLENSSTASPLLDKIEKNIINILVQGSDKPSFALLVKTALANKLQVTTRASGDVIYPPCGEVNRERKKLFKEIGGLI